MPHSDQLTGSCQHCHVVWLQKDLVEELEVGLSSSFEAAWRRQLDERLTAGLSSGSVLGVQCLSFYRLLAVFVLSTGGAEPVDCLQVAALACECLNKKRKKRPAMTEVSTCCGLSAGPAGLGSARAPVWILFFLSSLSFLLRCLKDFRTSTGL